MFFGLPLRGPSQDQAGYYRLCKANADFQVCRSTRRRLDDPRRGTVLSRRFHTGVGLGGRTAVLGSGVPYH